MQEEQEGRQEREQERPGGDGPAAEVEEPSAEEQTATAEEKSVAARGEEGSEPVEEAEEEELVEEELIQRRGCLRGCLTPIAAILAIALVMFMIIYAKRGAMSQWLRQRIIDNTQNHVLSDLPEGMDEKEIEAAFGEVKTALKEGRIYVEALDEAIKEYQDAVRKRPSLEEKKQEISKLMEGLNAAIIVPRE